MIWLVDPRLNDVYSLKGVQKAASLAARCLSRDPKARPMMQEVVEVLGPLQNHKDGPSSGFMFSAPPRDAKSRGSTLTNAQMCARGRIRN